MNSLSQKGIFSAHVKPDFAPRAIVLALVVFAHIVTFSIWPTQTDNIFVTSNELSVSFALAAQAPQPVIILPRQKAAIAVPVQLAEASQAETIPQATPAAVINLAPAEVAAAATEPDYKASYLNNPPPAYPMVARRQGLQGRVVLHVEVLADGVCGQIDIQKSSGYAMLDNAALQTVKNWRFMPASRAGRAVDKWFMIPIQFSLKDNTA